MDYSMPDPSFFGYHAPELSYLMQDQGFSGQTIESNNVYSIPEELASEILPQAAQPNPSFFDYSAPDPSYPTQNQDLSDQNIVSYNIDPVPKELSSETLPAAAQPASTYLHTSHPFDPYPTLYTSQPHDAQPVSDIQDIPLSPMGPPINTRKRKAPTLRSDAWHPYKDRIIELHITQGLPLREVKKLIEEEFSFTAEIRQYRTRITQWGLDKKVKPNEMKAIVRKGQRRKLVESDKGELVFVVRDNVVERGKVGRWMKRNGIGENVVYAPSPAASTPSAVGCWTISERGSPAPSPTYSAETPTFSMRGVPSFGQSPYPSSPASSVSSIVRSTNSKFTGQSPALSNRTIPSFLDGSDPVPEALTVQPGFLPHHSSGLVPQMQTEQPSTGSVQYRYRHMDEVRLRQDLSKLETLYGKDHLETLHALCDLGGVLSDQGRYKSAEEVFRRVVIARQNGNGHNDISTLEALEYLGNVLILQGLYLKGEKIHRRIFESRRDALGDEDPDTLRSMGNLALTYEKQGRWKEAEELEIQVIKTKKRVLGQEHPHTLSSMGNLAATYWKQGRLKEAEELNVQVMETRKRVLGQEHPDTLTSMGNLASTYWNQGRWKEAEELNVQVMKTSKKVLGQEHPDTLSSMNNHAVTLKSQGCDIDAIELMVKCVRLRKKILGMDHPASQSSIKRLKYWQAEDSLMILDLTEAD